MAWLAGFSNRIKLTIDSTKIDTSLTHFPVTVVLSGAQGAGVFAELGSDANRKKIAFTQADGTTELCGEIESFDYTNSKAVFHVSKSTWQISSSVNTDFYMYYDSTHADNTIYIGDTGSSPAQAVWDSNFEMVQHMSQDPSGTAPQIIDSTSNNNDGSVVSGGASLVSNTVGNALDFDGLTNRPMTVPSIAFETNDVTFETIFRTDQNRDKTRTLLACRDGETGCGITINGAGMVGAYCKPDSNSAGTAVACDDNSNHYVGVPIDEDGSFKVVLDETASTTALRGAGSWGTSTLYIADGENDETAWKELIGIIDEVRISFVVRTDAWLKTTKNTLLDTLLTYDEAETSPINKTIEVLAVAGGGGGSDSSWGGGGGGAGGVIHSTNFVVNSGTAIDVIVGLGGGRGLQGQNSTFGILTAFGGGPANSSQTTSSRDGGSGGGGSHMNPSGQPSSSIQTNNNNGQGYGNGGGGTTYSSPYPCGAGGGASTAGGIATAGGAGMEFSISGLPVYYAGGGGQASSTSSTVGGIGGGGNGANNTNAQSGDLNSGGGGGGADTGTAGSGGSGIIIISYATDGSDGIGTASEGGIITRVGNQTIHTFLSSGTFTVSSETLTLPSTTFNFSDWSNHVTLTIDGSLVNETLINFPTLITLSSGTGKNSFDTTQVFDEVEYNSKRIAITTTVNGTEVELYTEIEHWNSSTKEATLWTKVPTITSGTDTVLKLYFNNLHVNNDYLDVNTELLIQDSFIDAVGSDITIYGDPIIVPYGANNNQLLKDSVHFIEPDSYLSVPSSSDWDFGTSDFTIETYFKADNVLGTVGLFSLSTTNSGLLDVLLTGPNLSTACNNITNFTVVAGGTVIADGQFKLNAGVGATTGTNLVTTDFFPSNSGKSYELEFDWVCLAGSSWYDDDGTDAGHFITLLPSTGGTYNSDTWGYLRPTNGTQIVRLRSTKSNTINVGNASTSFSYTDGATYKVNLIINFLASNVIDVSLYIDDVFILTGTRTYDFGVGFMLNWHWHSYSYNGHYQIYDNIKFGESLSPNLDIIVNDIKTRSDMELDTWSHLALVKETDNLKFYLDGSLVSTTDVTGISFSSSGQPIHIGKCTQSSSTFFGHLSIFSIHNSVVYNNNFIPPRYLSEMVNDSDTKLFLDFTDIAQGETPTTILDSSASAHTVTNVNSKVSGCTYWWGKAIKFSGNTSDRLSVSNDHFAFGTGDFSISFWVLSDNITATNDGIFQISPTSGGLQNDTLNCVALGMLSSGFNLYYNDTNETNLGTTLVSNVWYHVTVERSSGMLTLYKNGESIYSDTDTKNYIGTNLVIGGFYSTSYLFPGKVAEFKILKGTTTSGSVPSSPEYIGYVGDTGSSQSTKVWDEDFSLVYHMNQDPSGPVPQIIDSTGYNHKGTMSGNMLSEDLVDGYLGKALEFDGTDDAITTPDNTASSVKGPLSFSSTESFTLEVIYEGNDTTSNSPRGTGLLGRDNSDLYAGLVLHLGYLEYIHYNSSWQNNIKSTTLVANDIPHTLSYTNYNELGSLFVDATKEVDSLPSTIDSSRYFTFTHMMANYNNVYTSGQISEVRVSKSKRSDNWLEVTHYSNSNQFIIFSDNSTFSFSNPSPANLENSYGFSTNISIYVSSTVSGVVPFYDATFYDNNSNKIGSTVSGLPINSIATISGVPTTSGGQLGYYVKAVSNDLYSVSQIYTFYSKYLYSGTVIDQGALASGILTKLHLQTTGELVDTSVSTSSGTFSLSANENAAHYIVALHPNQDYKALVYDRVVPTV